MASYFKPIKYPLLNSNVGLKIVILPFRIDLIWKQNHQNNSLTTNINIPGYNFEHTPTDSKAGGLLMYISDKISYKLCNDLNIHCSKQLELVFIEVLIPNNQNQLIRTVYKHPSINVSKFNHEYLLDIQQKLKIKIKI